MAYFGVNRIPTSGFQPGSFILNADDFGMDQGIDDAILSLAQRGVVTAVSAMVLPARWRNAGKALAQADVSKGLHLDLTSPFAGPDLRERSISRVVAFAYMGLLDRRGLRRSIQRQLQLYEDVIAEPPQFVDGHQHVHQLPAVRTELLSCLQEFYGDQACSIKLRSCLPRAWRGIEAAFVGWTGAAALTRFANSAGLRTNTDFAGVYSFSVRRDLRELWDCWLTSVVGTSPLIMCHPSKGSDEHSPAWDRIRAARLKEYAWLASGDFLELCSAAGRNPAKWS